MDKEYIFDEKGYKKPNARFIKYIINNECWECVSHAKDGKGYPRVARSIEGSGHRYSYFIHNGEIPKGMVIMHICDNPSCINPEHLKLGTQLDNMKDRDKKGRNTKGEKVGTSKLTEEQVMAILNDNRPMKEIAKNYPVNYKTISGIKKGTRWKHLYAKFNSSNG